LAPLIGKTLAVFSDTRVTINGKKLVETLLSITGEDTVPVNRKYREVVSVRLAVRFMIMSNELPVLPDNSVAIASRVIALFTPNSWLGREDPGLGDVLRKELPAILIWALACTGARHFGCSYTPEVLLLADANAMIADIAICRGRAAVDFTR
jgi:putative DNA primase/helicase